MHHYPFHPGDHMLDAGHLSLAEDATYRRALDLYYVSEAPLPNDKRMLGKRLRVDEETLSAVLNEFFILRADGWHHTRCDAEIAKYQARSAKAKQSGTLGGMAGKKRTGRVRLANARRTLTERQANQEPEPRTNINTPIIPLGGCVKGVKNLGLQNPADDPGPEARTPAEWAPTPEQQQVAGWFDRLPTTPWSRKELRAWQAICFEPDDMKILDWFYLRSGYGYLRKDLLRLLNNWRGEVERARKFAGKEDAR